MTNVTRLIAATTAALAALLAAPATSHAADEDPADCDSNWMSATELGQVHEGMRRFVTTRIIGGVGERLKDQSAPGYMVRRWEYCTDGSYYADQWLVYVRDAAGHWVVSEIR